MKISIYSVAILILIAVISACSINNTDDIPNTGSSISTGSIDDIPRSLSQSVVSSNSSGQRGIWVNGSGVVNVEPDLAILNFGIETTNVSVELSTAKVKEVTNQIFAFLDEQSIDSKDIKTQSINIYPRYDYNNGKQKLIGYTSSYKISVNIRDLSDSASAVSRIIDGVSKAGGDSIRIDDIRFAREDNSQSISDAREKAVIDAVAKADQFAQLTGISRGDLVYISEYTPPSYASGDMQLRSMSVALEDYSSTPIRTGQLDIRIEIQAVFSINAD